MIRLAGNISKFVSSTFSHTSSTSNSGIPLSFTHNLGGPPEVIEVQMLIGGEWIKLCDYENTSTNARNYGWEVGGGSTDNELELILYRLRSHTGVPGSNPYEVASATVRVICIKL